MPENSEKKEVKKEEYEKKKEETKKRLAEYIKEEFGEEILEEIKGEKPLEILGILVENDKCYKILVGRYVIVGKIVSRTKSIIVVEDVFHRRSGIQVNKINMIGEIDCSSLEDIREQIERRKKRKK